MAKIITILAGGFEEIEAITTIDLLRRAGNEVTVLGLSSTTVNGSHNITVKTDGILKDFKGQFDGIVLPGGQPGTTNLGNSNEVLELVRSAYAKGLLCAAICAAPSVLGKAGILKGKKATCYPGTQDKLAGATYQEIPVVRDGNIITSRGVGTAIAFALEIISYFNGTEAAARIAISIVYTPNQESA